MHIVNSKEKGPLYYTTISYPGPIPRMLPIPSFSVIIKEREKENPETKLRKNHHEKEIRNIISIRKAMKIQTQTKDMLDLQLINKQWELLHYPTRPLTCIPTDKRG
jgi:hypothetical protein